MPTQMRLFVSHFTLRCPHAIYSQCRWRPLECRLSSKPLLLRSDSLPADCPGFSCWQDKVYYKCLCTGCSFICACLADCTCYLDMNPLTASFSAELPDSGAKMSRILTQPAVPMPTTTAPNILAEKQRLERRVREWSQMGIHHTVIMESQVNQSE